MCSLGSGTLYVEFRIRYRALCVFLQRCGPREGPRAPAAPPPACRGAQEQAARHLGDGHDLRWRGRHPGAHPCAAHRPLQHGRGAHQLQGPGQLGVEGGLPSVTCCVSVLRSVVLCLCCAVLCWVSAVLCCVYAVLCLYCVCAVLCCVVSMLCCVCIVSVLCCVVLLALLHTLEKHNFCNCPV